jgi:hypothetical protein
MVNSFLCTILNEGLEMCYSTNVMSWHFQYAPWDGEMIIKGASRSGPRSVDKEGSCYSSNKVWYKPIQISWAALKVWTWRTENISKECCCETVTRWAPQIKLSKYLKYMPISYVHLIYWYCDLIVLLVLVAWSLISKSIYLACLQNITTNSLHMNIYHP